MAESYFPCQLPISKSCASSAAGDTAQADIGALVFGVFLTQTVRPPAPPIASPAYPHEEHAESSTEQQQAPSPEPDACLAHTTVAHEMPTMPASNPSHTGTDPAPAWQQPLSEPLLHATTTLPQPVPQQVAKYAGPTTASSPVPLPVTATETVIAAGQITALPHEFVEQVTHAAGGMATTTTAAEGVPAAPPALPWKYPSTSSRARATAGSPADRHPTSGALAEAPVAKHTLVGSPAESFRPSLPATDTAIPADQLTAVPHELVGQVANPAGVTGMPNAATVVSPAASPDLSRQSPPASLTRATVGSPADGASASDAAGADAPLSPPTVRVLSINLPDPADIQPTDETVPLLHVARLVSQAPPAVGADGYTAVVAHAQVGTVPPSAPLLLDPIVAPELPPGAMTDDALPAKEAASVTAAVDVAPPPTTPGVDTGWSNFSAVIPTAPAWTYTRTEPLPIPTAPWDAQPLTPDFAVQPRSLSTPGKATPSAPPAPKSAGHLAPGTAGDHGGTALTEYALPVGENAQTLMPAASAFATAEAQTPAQPSSDPAQMPILFTGNVETDRAGTPRETPASHPVATAQSLLTALPESAESHDNVPAAADNRVAVAGEALTKQASHAQQEGSASDSPAVAVPFAPVTPKAGVAQSGTPQTDAVSSPRIVGILERMATATRAQGSNTRQEVQLRLDPPVLGTLRITVSAGNDGAITAVIETTNTAVHDLLRTHLPELRQSLADGGMTVGQCQVTLRDQSQSHDAPFERHAPRGNALPATGAPASAGVEEWAAPTPSTYRLDLFA